MENRALEISWASLWRILFFIILVIFMFMAKNVILGLFLAIVISSGLEIPIDILEKRKIPRTVSAILIFLFIVLVIAVLIYAVVPLVLVNLNTAIFNIQKASQGTWWQSLFNIKTSRSLNDFMSRIIDNFVSGGASPLEAVSQVFGGLSLTISVFILSFYLSVNKNGIERFVRIISPDKYEEAVLRIFEHSRRRIGLWFRTQFFLSLIVGLVVWAALGFLGVPYAPILGAIAGIFELIPFVGPIIAGAVSVLVAISISPALAIYTLITFLVIQQLESNVLVPLLMRRAAGLHPVLVIVSILMGIEIGGFLGAVVAVPAAAVFQEIAEDWDRDKMALKAAK
ncbi:MAG: AI-2E family transporter [Candidatus Liptonbacteria bacterium]|nr:AI-2E family transporter [Candidatus Liptonbacteria bacterium]